MEAWEETQGINWLTLNGTVEQILWGMDDPIMKQLYKLKLAPSPYLALQVSFLSAKVLCIRPICCFLHCYLLFLLLFFVVLSRYLLQVNGSTDPDALTKPTVVYTGYTDISKVDEYYFYHGKNSRSVKDFKDLKTFC